MCFSCSLAIPASPLVVQDDDDGQPGPGAAVPRTLERNRPDLVPNRPRTYVASMDILTDVLDCVRLKGTVLFHHEFARAWSVALARSADAIFHSRWPSAISSSLSAASPHVLWSGRGAKPVRVADLDRWSAHVGLIHHGGGRKPFSTMICGRFSLLRPSPSNVLKLLPPILRLRPSAD